MKDRKKKLLGLGLCFTVLPAMLLFFEIAHPLVVLDADDWTYISQSRMALPSTGFWNPARILPEVLMPYASALGVMLFRPLGYIPSITAMNGLVLSLFITAYVYAFFRLLTDTLDLGPARAAGLALVFLLLHFTIFRTQAAQNQYLFWAKDLTCVYYYVIPALLNCSLVMTLARTGLHRRLWERGELASKSLLLLFAYLAVFSNLFESAILACWCALELLAALLRKPRRRPDRAFWKEQSFSLALLLLWLLSVWFESRGGRGAASSARPYGEALGESFRQAGSFFGGVYLLVLLLCGAVFAALLAALLLRVFSREERSPLRGLLLPLLLMGLLILLFEILLCGKVDPAYARRSDVMFGPCFVLLALTILTLGLLLRRFEKLALLLPLLFLILFSATDTWSRTFLDSNDILAPAELCTALDETLVEQVLAAQDRGETSVTLHVPDYCGGDNWPHASYLGGRMAASLYKHGQTRELMEIRILPDRALNEQFGILVDPAP